MKKILSKLSLIVMSFILLLPTEVVHANTNPISHDANSTDITPLLSEVISINPDDDLPFGVLNAFFIEDLGNGKKRFQIGDTAVIKLYRIPGFDLSLNSDYLITMRAKPIISDLNRLKVRVYDTNLIAPPILDDSVNVPYGEYETINFFFRLGDYSLYSINLYGGFYIENITIYKV